MCAVRGRCECVTERVFAPARHRTARADGVKITNLLLPYTYDTNVLKVVSSIDRSFESRRVPVLAYFYLSIACASLRTNLQQSYTGKDTHVAWHATEHDTTRHDLRSTDRPQTQRTTYLR